MVNFYQWQDNDLVLTVKVQPKASKDEIGRIIGDALKVRITAPPIDGKANKHLIAYLSKTFKVTKSNIKLLSGETSRDKRFLIIHPNRLPETIKPL